MTTDSKRLLCVKEHTMAHDERVIKSYVWHEGKCFFVSTIERDSSAMLGPERYYETMVWEFDWKKNERGAWIAQEGCSRGFLREHFSMCERLHETGDPNKAEANDVYA